MPDLSGLRKTPYQQRGSLYQNSARYVNYFLGASEEFFWARSAFGIGDVWGLALLNSVFPAEPWSRIVEEIICDVFIYAVPADMDKQHGLDLPEDQEYVCVLMTDKTSARHVFLMKLVISCIVVFRGHVVSYIKLFRNKKTSRGAS